MECDIDAAMTQHGLNEMRIDDVTMDFKKAVYDVMEYFDFDIEKAKENIKNINPNAKIICVSAKSGEGMDEFVGWLKETINK